MGVSFHSAGCIKVAKECSTESSAININSSQCRATKIQEKPAGGVTGGPVSVDLRRQSATGRRAEKVFPFGISITKRRDPA
jgi:hypothetical protein